jgi:hypothetical protein
VSAAQLGDAAVASSSQQQQQQLPLDQTLIVQLRSVLTPFMLRRSKTEVLGSLPPKTDSVVLVGATAAQAAVYRNLISDARTRLIGEAAPSGGQTRTLIDNSGGGGGGGGGTAATVESDAALARALAATAEPQARNKRQAAVRAEQGIAAGNAFFGASVTAATAKAVAAAERKQGPVAASAAAAGAIPGGSGGGGGGSASAPAAAGTISKFFSSSGPQRRAVAEAEDATAPLRAVRASGGATSAAARTPAAAVASVIVLDSPFDVETTPGARGGASGGAARAAAAAGWTDATGAVILDDDDIVADTPCAAPAAGLGGGGAGRTPSRDRTPKGSRRGSGRLNPSPSAAAKAAGVSPEAAGVVALVESPPPVQGGGAVAPAAPAVAAMNPGAIRRVAGGAKTITPFTEERTAGAVAQPGASDSQDEPAAAPAAGEARSGGGSGGGGVPRSLNMGVDPVQAAGEPAAAAPPPGSGSSAVVVVDPAVASRLARAVAKAGKRAVGNIFFDLRKAASHPLLLRVRYTHEPSLRRIAGALMSAGAFGTAKSLTLDKALAELAGSSDLEIHSMCAHYGTGGRYEMIDDLPAVDGGGSGGGGGGGGVGGGGGGGLAAASAAATAETPQIVAPGGLSGAALLRACRLPLSSVLCGSKAAWLGEQLPLLLGAGHRVLIFSMWTSVLDILEVLLGQALGIEYVRLDGSTKVDERQHLIDAFNAPGSAIPVFLLSTKAGGLGINLTTADTVVVHDLSFNPQDDAQAVDRAHRLGQTRPVRVMRLVTAATVDEGVYRLAAGKTALDLALKGSGRGGGGDDVPAASIGELLAKALC